MKRIGSVFCLLLLALPALSAERSDVDRLRRGVQFREMTAPPLPPVDVGHLYAADSSGTTLLFFEDHAGTITNLLTAATGTAGVEFEGATANEFETTLNVVDPTADRAINLPNAAGAVMLSSLATNAAEAANSVWGASNGLVFEGATANNFEVTLAPADVGADVTITLPAMAGTVMLSALATNAVDAANSVTGISNGLIFEGATADGFEITLAPADAGADATVTIPAITGTVAMDTRTIDNDNNGQTVALDANTLHTNSGAVGGGTWALPEASTWIGKTLCFAVITAQALTINPADSPDQILALTNAAGDAISNATIGNNICLMAVAADAIIPINIYGTWTDAN